MQLILPVAGMAALNCGTLPPVRSTQAAPTPRLYPAITACIRDQRSPTRDEIRRVASRLWREGLASRFGPELAPASVAARRVLLRAAVATLSGKAASARDDRP